MQLILSEMMQLISLRHVRLLSYSFIEITKIQLSTPQDNLATNLLSTKNYKCAYVVVLLLNEHTHTYCRADFLNMDFIFIK